MKSMCKIILTLALCMMLCVPAMAAELGELETVVDIVTPDGQNAKISTIVTGVTDSEGKLALPAYKDASLDDAAATQGTLQGAPEKAANGGAKYYIAQFSEKEAPVTLTLAWTQEGTYVPGKAKTKDTAPGNLKAFVYSMTNSAPLKIGSYVLDMALPQGWELSSIVGYDAEEDFDIYVKDGMKYGHYTFGELGIGGKAKFTINASQTGAAFTAVMWIITIGVSAFFLYKNKEMLTEAKEADAKKKAEKGT